MNIENIALSGGGLKGIAYVGCFKAFEEYGIIKNLKRVAGTSIGAIFGYGLLLGFTADELSEIMCKINYTFLRDINIDNILSFSNFFGFDTGNNIEKVFRIITEKRGFSPNITFEQFYQINGIEFIVVGTCVSTRQKVEFSYKTYPNFSIIQALRISSGLPLIFNKVTINNEDYADGCLKENTPISCFTNEEDIEKTIAILLSSESVKYESTLQNYFYNVILCMTETMSELQLKDYMDYTINLNKIKMTSQTSITEQEKIEIIDYAYNTTIEYLEHRKLKYTDMTQNTHSEPSSVSLQKCENIEKKQFSKLTEQINDILNYNT